MTISGIENIGVTSFVNQFNALNQQHAENNSFQNWLISELAKTNVLLNSSEADLKNLATGNAESIHHVMLSLEKANTAFQLTLQIRNKLLDGYKEIMRMQV